MSQPLQLLNFCKSGLKKVDKSFTPAAPLATVSLLGLNSFGCQPLLSHRSDTGQHILSQIKQTNGAVVRNLLSSQADGGIIGGGPPAEEDLPYGANIAGLRGATPLTGNATSPFPTTIATTDLLWTVATRKWTHTINGTAQDLSADTDALAIGGTGGFGGILTGQSGVGTLVQLPPDSREYNGGVRLRANHNYVSTLTLPYSPELEPLSFHFSTVTNTYTILGGTVGGTFTNVDSGTCEVEPVIASVVPCLTAQSGVLISPSNNEPNGPSLHRQYNLCRLSSFVMPPAGAAYSATWDFPSTDLKAVLCVYVNSSRIDNVACHEGATTAVDSVTLPALDPAVFNGLVFDTIYQFAVNGNEATYTFDVTKGTTTISPLLTLSPVPTQYRYYECFFDMHQSGNPSLGCS
jgi:hypothetical protein